MTSFSRGYWTVWTATLLFFVAFYTLLVPLPLYLSGVGLPDWLVGVVMGAFGVASLVSRPLAGLLSDRWDRRLIMLVGAASLFVGAAGVGLTASPPLLFLLRLLQAVGYVAFTTAGTALVSDLAAPEERAARLAFFGIAANVAVTTVPAAVSAFLDRLTIPGALTLAGLLAALGGGLALFVPSVRVQADGTPPAWASLLRPPPSLLLPMAASWLLGLGFGAYLQFVPLLAERRALGPAGLVYSVYGVSIILTRLLTGRRLDQGDRVPLLRTAFLVMAAGLVLFALATSLPVLLVGAACVAAGGGILHPALIAIHVERLSQAERGRAVGFFYLGFDLGIGLGAWVLSPILQTLGLTGMYLFAALATAGGVLLVRRVAARVQVETLKVSETLRV